MDVVSTAVLMIQAAQRCDIEAVTALAETADEPAELAGTLAAMCADLAATDTGLARIMQNSRDGGPTDG